MVVLKFFAIWRNLRSCCILLMVLTRRIVCPELHYVDASIMGVVRVYDLDASTIVCEPVSEML